MTPPITVISGKTWTSQTLLTFSPVLRLPAFKQKATFPTPRGPQIKTQQRLRWHLPSIEESHRGLAAASIHPLDSISDFFFSLQDHDLMFHPRS